MIFVFSLFVVLVALFILPPLLLPQQQNLQDVEDSLTVRLHQLKQEFKFRTRELGRRLKSGDLAQEEWQQLTDELQLDTSASIESTQLASVSRKSGVSKTVAFVILIAMIAAVYMSYTFSGDHEPAKRHLSIISQLKNDPGMIEKLTQQAQSENTQETLESLFLALRSQVDLAPENVDHWLALARFNSRVGRSGEAHEAMNNALQLDPNNIDIQVEFAQLLSRSEDQGEREHANRLLVNIIKQNPDHEGARLMLGFSAFALGAYQTAIDSWGELLKKQDENSQSAKMLQKSIDAARQKLAEESATQETVPVKSDAKVMVTLEIPESIRARLSGDETVFVFAKAVDGPQFPIAVVKTSFEDMPGKFVLSDANAMQAQFQLSNYSNIRVSARISQSGNPIAQPGDIEGISDIIGAPFLDTEVVLNMAE